MRDEGKAGIALIVGSVGGVVTMAIHPTMASEHLAVLSGVAHSLAMVSVLLLFLGAYGMARSLHAPDRLAFVGLVTFGLASVAVTIATAISGFVVPGALRLMHGDVPAAASQWRIAIAVVFQINQAFSRMYSVETSAAIVL